MARQGLAGLGLAWLGRAGHGKAWRGYLIHVSHGMAWYGSAWHGAARRGMAGLGQARRGAARQGKAGRGLQKGINMTTNIVPFQPKDGLPEWRKIYNAISREVGAIIKFEDLSVIIKRDFKTSRGPIYRVIRELEANDYRTLISVKGVGYKVADVSEHEYLGLAHHKRSRKNLQKSINKFQSADRELMDDEIRARFDMLAIVAARQLMHIRKLDARMDRQERLLEDIATKGDEDRTKLDDLINKLHQRGLI